MIVIIMRLVITEVMANPFGSTGKLEPEDRNEYVELFNNSDSTVDLTGFHITDLDSKDTIIAWTDDKILSFYPGVKINELKLAPFSYALIMDPEYTVVDSAKGGYCQPYDIPEGVLIVTVGNTTIGNELQNNDPLVLYNNDSTFVTTFGTPFDDDEFPYSAGNGHSWERVDILGPDKADNWLPSVDDGPTPGRENKVGIVETVDKSFSLIIDKEIENIGKVYDLRGRSIYSKGSMRSGIYFLKTERGFERYIYIK